MRLALSSAAAPTLPPSELFAACARRGIAGVELVQGHAHGIGLGSSDTEIRRMLHAAAAAGVSIVAFEDVHALGAIVEAHPDSAGLAWDLTPVRPGTGTDKGTGTDTGMGATDTLSLAGVLELCGGMLRHIRLLGGGPEAAAQEGLGIGELAVRLTLSGFPGALALAPSTPRYLTAWGVWLGRRGWGCGSKEEPVQPLRLGGAA